MNIYLINGGRYRNVYSYVNKEIKNIYKKLCKNNAYHFNVIKIDDFNIEKAVKDGYHIVCIGFIGLTMFSSICQFWLNPEMKQEQQQVFVEMVNSSQETGTLFPNYKLTILPYRYRTTAFMTVGSYDYTDGKGFDFDDIKKHLEDAFEAEIKYINSKKMYFCFLDLDPEIEIKYIYCLYELLNDKYQNYDGDIYMHSALSPY